jgi:uncharacterized protein YceH (UPF0502 family)
MDDAKESLVATETRPPWQPIPALERRIVGVLVEKAKTTPDAYPMSLNGLVTGCNQKSNRFPQMQVEPDDLDPVLENLRKLGAVTEVLGGGRVSKFRHHMYEWLGVGKVEMAVMAELLLRGAQSLGELRGRASRMEPIADMSALKPVLDSLERKGLIVFLTPPGRGQVVTHALYEPRELEKLKAQFANHTGGDEDADDEAVASQGGTPRRSAPPRSEELESLRDEVRQLREEMEQLKAEFAGLRAGIP